MQVLCLRRDNYNKAGGSDTSTFSPCFEALLFVEQNNRFVLLICSFV